MSTNRENRTERIQARTTKGAKGMLETAAALQGMSVSEFVLASALDRAAETVRAHTHVQLSALDSQAFAEALLNPPTPNDALRAARDRYLVEVEG